MTAATLPGTPEDRTRRYAEHELGRGSHWITRRDDQGLFRELCRCGTGEDHADMSDETSGVGMGKTTNAGGGVGGNVGSAAPEGVQEAPEASGGPDGSPDPVVTLEARPGDLPDDDEAGTGAVDLLGPLQASIDRALAARGGGDPEAASGDAVGPPGPPVDDPADWYRSTAVYGNPLDVMSVDEVEAVRERIRDLVTATIEDPLVEHVTTASPGDVVVLRLTGEALMEPTIAALEEGGLVPHGVKLLVVASDVEVHKAGGMYQALADLVARASESLAGTPELDAAIAALGRTL